MSSSDSAATTRSFQNEPLPKKRLSADKKLLADATNLDEPLAKRQCSNKAGEGISQMNTVVRAPRGDRMK